MPGNKIHLRIEPYSFGFSCFSVFLCLLLSQAFANAQTFESYRRGQFRHTRQQEPFISPMPTSFDKSFQDFNKSLSGTAARMRKEYDKSNLDAARRQEINDQAIQTDTVRTSQDAFVNTQVEAVTSGGLYNGPGTTVVGAQVVAAPAVRGRYYSAPRKGIYRSYGSGNF